MSQNSRFTKSVLVFVVCFALLTTIGFSSQGNGQNPTRQPAQKLTAAQQKKLPELKAVSANIRRVARILEAEGIQVQAGDLISSHGRKKARAQVAVYPDMYLSRLRSEPLRGVVMADTLTLPEKVKIDSDTVIIANNVVFHGRAPVIKGPHDIHVFVFGSVKAANGRETVITIDTSGAGRDEWLASRRQIATRKSKQELVTNHPLSAAQQPEDGADGQMGTSGTHGNDGDNGNGGNNGSCSGNKNGANATPGVSAQGGGNGGTGTNGNDAGSASSQTLAITSVTAGSFNLVAKGGKGGNGGPGGPGGFGGRGGNGGKGGDGAGCNCNAGGLGEGGAGGAAGNGGSGGTGGKGGKGGKGGAGGAVVISFPWGYDPSQVSVNALGGSGGQGGVGGTAGVPGTFGSPGAGGHGGSVFGCDPARDGTAGASASGGSGGSGGDGGDAGTPGTPGPVTWTVIGGPEGGGGGGGGSSEPNGWEPGTAYQTCTEWFFVSYHCESLINSLTPKTNKFLANHSQPLMGASGWTCVETGRTYIGCF